MAMKMQTPHDHWVRMCEFIGGEEAVVARLAQVIHEQRSGLDGEPTCGECKHRARLFFDAAAEADWWPLGYGTFKVFSHLMGCTEDKTNYTPPVEED